MEMSTEIRTGTDTDRRGANGTKNSALTENERIAWEAVLGLPNRGNETTRWGRAVAAHLFAQPEERRIKYLEHALNIFPFVSRTPVEGFGELLAMTQDEIDEAVAKLGELRALEIIQHLKKPGGATMAAISLLELMVERTDDERAFLLANAFLAERLADRVRENPLPERSTERTCDDGHEVLVKNRSAVRTMTAAIDHVGCNHTTPEDVGRVVIDQLERIAAEDRAYVLGQLLHNVHEVARGLGELEERQRAEFEARLAKDPIGTFLWAFGVNAKVIVSDGSEIEFGGSPPDLSAPIEGGGGFVPFGENALDEGFSAGPPQNPGSDDERDGVAWWPVDEDDDGGDLDDEDDYGD